MVRRRMIKTRQCGESKYMGKKMQKWLLCAVCCLLCMVLRAPVTTGAAYATEGVYVYDDAELFSYTERTMLQEYLEKIGNKENIGIYVLTSDDSGNGTSDFYLESFYDAGFNTDGIRHDAVLMHIDMEERYVNIQAYGAAEDKISDATGERIIDALWDDLHYGKYYDACITFADEVQHYMNYVPVYLRTLPQLLVAMAIGAIAVGIMVAGSGGKMTVNGNTYLDRGASGVKASRDEYIRTSVTKRKKPESSSGSSSRHVSSGGHSHSSSGRHF